MNISIDLVIATLLVFSKGLKIISGLGILSTCGSACGEFLIASSILKFLDTCCANSLYLNQF